MKANAHLDEVFVNTTGKRHYLADCRCGSLSSRGDPRLLHHANLARARSCGEEGEGVDKSEIGAYLHYRRVSAYPVASNKCPCHGDWCRLERRSSSRPCP